MAQEHAAGQDAFSLSAGAAIREKGHHWTNFQVEKWDAGQIGWTRARDYDGQRLIRPGAEPAAADFRRLRCPPFQTYLHEDANLIVDSGWVMIMNGIAGSSVSKFTSGTRGRIGGGTSSTAAAASQTDLQAATGSTTRQWEVLSAAPTVGPGTGSGNGLILAAQFPTTDGNFAWAEFGVDSGTAAGTGASTTPMFSRGVSSPGTKTSSQTWNATVTYQWT